MAFGIGPIKQLPSSVLGTEKFTSWGQLWNIFPTHLSTWLYDVPICCFFFISPPRARGSTYLRLSPAKVFSDAKPTRCPPCGVTNPVMSQRVVSVFRLSPSAQGLCRMLQLSCWPGLWSSTEGPGRNGMRGNLSNLAILDFFYDHGRTMKTLQAFSDAFILLISWAW